MPKRPVGQRGKGVDAEGGPVVDPTQNVLDLVEAANLRQDDLRRVEFASLRRELAIRAEYDEKLRLAETQRIDAIRSVDVDAVRRANEVAELRAATLQGQVAAAAEAMRTTAASIQQSNVEGLAAAIKPLTDAVALIQQQQNIQAGQKVQVAETRDTRGEARLNIGAVFAGMSLLLALIGFLIATR